jgi:hypothetical protein
VSIDRVISKLTIADRVMMAKAKTERVLDHLLYVLELHENNAIVVYSPTLASQIPTSFAANAFNVLQQGLHQMEIVRLCALWDGADMDKENIATIIELIDHPDIIEALARETAAHWHGQSGHFVNPSDDPELRKLEIEAVRRSNQEFGDEQAQLARDELRQAIDESRAILASSKLASIMNLRDKHLAHSLTETRRERKVGSIEPMKYGDEREMLNASLPIVRMLYSWVNGTSFDLEESRQMDRENARALWGACTFNIRP